MKKFEQHCQIGDIVSDLSGNTNFIPELSNLSIEFLKLQGNLKKYFA